MLRWLPLEGWVPLSQLVPQQAAPVPVAPAPIQAAAVPEQVAAGATVPAQGGGKKKLLIAIGAGVGVLAILAGVWVFLIRMGTARVPPLQHFVSFFLNTDRPSFPARPSCG